MKNMPVKFSSQQKPLATKIPIIGRILLEAEIFGEDFGIYERSWVYYSYSDWVNIHSIC